MKVQDFMRTHVVTATPSTPLASIWRLLFQKHVHSLPIVDGKNKLLGIIVKEDFLAKLFPDYTDLIDRLKSGKDDDLKDKLNSLKGVTVEKVMNKQVYFAHPETDLMRALSRMILYKIRQLPVLDDDGSVMGVISKGDIFNRLFRNKKDEPKKEKEQLAKK